MTAETASFAEGAIEVTLLQQQGRDPFTPTPERTAQIADVASRIANFIGEAKSTIDIAIYDFRLRDEAAAIVGDGLRAQARKGVQVRIAYDHSADPGPDAIPSAAPSHLESDQKPLGTDSFVRSLADIAQVKGVTGYRVLMHNKYIVRDAASADAAVFTGSSNYTNDSWGLQDNNLLCLRSQQLASYYARDFADLWSRGKIVDSTGSHDIGTVRLGDVAVTIAFTPGESAAAPTDPLQCTLASGAAVRGLKIEAGTFPGCRRRLHFSRRSWRTASRTASEAPARIARERSPSRRLQSAGQSRCARHRRHQSRSRSRV